jgi:hypothetical protein
LVGGALLLTGIALCLSGNGKEQAVQQAGKSEPVNE